MQDFERYLLFKDPFANEEDLDTYLLKFAFYYRLREGQKRLEEIRDFYEHGPSSFVGSPETFGRFVHDWANEKHPALRQVLAKLLKNISHPLDQRSPMAYVLHMLLMRMKGREDRDRGDGENPETTACLDVLLFHYFHYCKNSAERKKRRPLDETDPPKKEKEENGITAEAGKLKDPRFPRRKSGGIEI